MRTLRDEVGELFAAVSEAIARASAALLESDGLLADAVVAGEVAINAKAADVEAAAWAFLDGATATAAEIRTVVAMLLIVPELERSADLAEHIAHRAMTGLGRDMSPASRGIVARMGEVAVGLWQATVDAFTGRLDDVAHLDEADDELDVLHERLTTEVASGSMLPTVAAQVTLVARFFERLGDHAVNLARRSASLG